jgi:hypothetical protein
MLRKLQDSPEKNKRGKTLQKKLPKNWLLKNKPKLMLIGQQLMLN